jgi:hypothetical protein
LVYRISKILVRRRDSIPAVDEYDKEIYYRILGINTQESAEEQGRVRHLNESL